MENNRPTPEEQLHMNLLLECLSCMIRIAKLPPRQEIAVVMSLLASLLVENSSAEIASEALKNVMKGLNILIKEQQRNRHPAQEMHKEDE